MRYYQWAPYVSVAKRRREAERAMGKLQKQGHPVSPVHIEGRTIAKTFWGKAWCDNLEGYSDYSNRLPRGRTYVRNGSVLDLQMAAGEIKALVSGSHIYTVAVQVTPVAPALWRSVCRDCAGAIDSLIELLQGRFSQGVMERLCRRPTGLFPSPGEIKFSCSCPDWASMCKHVAAVLYGIGARLDTEPELLFRLRKVDEKDLVIHAGTAVPLSKKQPAAAKVLASDDLSKLFDLDLPPEDTVRNRTTPKTTRSSAPKVGAKNRTVTKAVPKTTKKKAASAPRTGTPKTTTKKAATARNTTKKKAATARNTTKKKAATAPKTTTPKTTKKMLTKDAAPRKTIARRSMEG